MYKTWGIGDIIKSGNGLYESEHLEAPEGSDVNNHITLQRTFNNVHHNIEDIKKIVDHIASSFGRTSGMFSGLDFEPEIVSIVDGSLGTQLFMRTQPGVYYNSGETYLYGVPQTHIMSRQLEEIFSLVTWTKDTDREYVEVTYNHSTDTFSCEIKANSITYTFSNSSAIALLYDIYSENSNFQDSLENALKDGTFALTDLNKIASHCEPTFAINDDSSYFFGLDGALYNSSSSGALDFYEYSSVSSGILTIETDNREYVQTYNSFENELILNAPLLESYTAADIVNSDITLTFLKQNSGSYANGIILFDESEDEFAFNKNISGSTIEASGNITAGTINGLAIEASTSTLNMDANLQIGFGEAGGALTISNSDSNSTTLTLSGNPLLAGDSTGTFNTDFTAGDATHTGDVTIRSLNSSATSLTLSGTPSLAGNSTGTFNTNFTAGDSTHTGAVTVQSASSNATTITGPDDATAILVEGTMVPTSRSINVTTNATGGLSGGEGSTLGSDINLTLSLINLAAGDPGTGALWYNGNTQVAGQLDGGGVNPTSTTRLNYDGNFYATNIYGVNSIASLGSNIYFGLVSSNDKIVHSNDIFEFQEGGFAADSIIKAGTFNSVSSREEKKNITDFAESALSIIEKVNVVSYQYKNQKNDFYHTGFIAEDTPKILTGETHDTMSLSDTIGVLLKAVQELKEENNKLKKELTI